MTADLRGCAPPSAVMRDVTALRALCLAAVEAAGLRPVGELFHAFAPPGGVTGMVLLCESHVALHTWPELDAVTIDVYVCNLGADNSARADALLASLVAAFHAEHIERHALQRGSTLALGIAE